MGYPQLHQKTARRRMADFFDRFLIPLLTVVYVAIASAPAVLSSVFQNYLLWLLWVPILPFVAFSADRMAGFAEKPELFVKSS